MSKPSAPSGEFQPPANGPPSYNQAMSEGAMPQPPPGPADYKPPLPPQQQPAPYGGYGPPPGAAGHGQPPPAGGYPPQQYGQYGVPPGVPPPQQVPLQQQQYGPAPGVPPQQYGQYGAPPGLPVGAPAVVIQTVPCTGPNSTHMICPQCHAEIDTTVNSSPSTTAWVAGLIIALFGCWMGCCLIPCCMDECMNKEHYCPNCKAFIGSYRS